MGHGGRLSVGKVPPQTLRKLVFPHYGARREEVLVRPAVGQDAAVMDLAGDLVVVSSDPITGATEKVGYLAVHVGCNDVAAMGAIPVGVVVVLLLPEGTSEAQLDSIMREISEASREIGVEVLGGHTEVTPGLPQPIVMVTALGRASGGRIFPSSGAQPGDQIVLTKSAGWEGTGILAADYGAELARALPADLLQRARSFCWRISIVREAVVASARGARAMHDVTEGGVLGALFEMADASGLGFEVWESKIPVAAETRAICQYFGIDPLRLVSSGCLLVAAEDGEGLVQALAAEGLSATVIGHFTPGSARVLVDADGRRRNVRPPESDELWRVRSPRLEGQGS